MGHMNNNCFPMAYMLYMYVLYNKTLNVSNTCRNSQNFRDYVPYLHWNKSWNGSSCQAQNCIDQTRQSKVRIVADIFCRITKVSKRLIPFWYFRGYECNMYNMPYLYDVIICILSYLYIVFLWRSTLVCGLS